MNNRISCVICAWRKNCKKKFSMSKGQINCPDFAEDISIKEKEEDLNENKDRGSIKKNSNFKI